MKSVLRRQKTLWLGLQLIAALLFFFICVEALGIEFFVSSQEKPKQTIAQLPDLKPEMQDLWMAKVDSEKKILEERMQFVETQFLESKSQALKQAKENQKLSEEIQLLKMELQRNADLKKEELKSEKNLEAPIEAEKKLQVQKFKVLSMPEPAKNVHSSIAAGTTVKAVLLSSTDAICGVYSSSDPQPVKLRLIDDAHLPKALKAPLKGAVIIASAYGNLSSERVYMRLERLTKFSSNGDFIETEVAGYVSGEDGKYGVRGVVADKSEQFVGNAALSGFFSGMAGYFHSKKNPGQLSGDPLYMELLKEGGSKGSGDAFEKLSEYYIKRAEQLQPVIQVAAGRLVDITFTHGVSFGGQDCREKIHKLREERKRVSP